MHIGLAAGARRRVSTRASSQHLGRQVLGLDHLGRRHHGQPVADVLQLAHVAGKVERAQLLQRRVGNALGLHAELLGALLQEMAREHGHVFAALAQRRQAQADHVEAVEQVLAEHAFLDALLQVLVGGGDHAHIGLARRCGRRRGRNGRRDSTRSRRVCRSNGMSPISSRNSVPPSACSKRPRRMVCAPVKAPRSWPNSSDSSRSFGMAAVLMATNGPAGARRMLVQRARHQFLARARFAGDQHRDLALAQAADGAEHVLHGRRLAQHLGRGGHALLGHFLALAFLHRAADQLDRLGQVERLGQVFERAALEGRHGAVQVGERRHDDDRQAGQLFLDLVQQVQAGAAGHADVAHQDLRAVALGGVRPAP